MIIVESKTLVILLRWFNLYNLAESGILAEIVQKNEGSNDAAFYFNIPQGRAWWEYNSRAGGLNDDYLPAEMKSHY